jgi:dienelactone hydrolase
MNPLTHASERFELVDPHEARRIVRGRVVLPEPSSAPPPAVLVLHGFKGFMDWGFFPLLAHELAQAGLAAVAFNTSGSGIGPDLATFTEDEAFARDTFTRQLEDVERVRAHVERELGGRRELVDAARLGIFGHSRGGGMALIHAAERGDYRAIATWAAIPDTARFDPETIALWRRQGYVLVPNARTGREHRVDVGFLEDLERNRARLDVQAACRRLAAPTLLVHGEQDDVVPAAALERLAAAVPASCVRAVRIPGAGHTLGARHPLERVPAELAQALSLTVEHFVRALGR